MRVIAGPGGARGMHFSREGSGGLAQKWTARWKQRILSVFDVSHERLCKSRRTLVAHLSPWLSAFLLVCTCEAHLRGPHNFSYLRSLPISYTLWSFPVHIFRLFRPARFTTSSSVCACNGRSMIVCFVLRCAAVFPLVPHPVPPFPTPQIVPPKNSASLLSHAACAQTTYLG